MEKTTKKDMQKQIDNLESRIGILESQVKTLASVFKGMLEVAQNDNSAIVKPGEEKIIIDIIN